MTDQTRTVTTRFVYDVDQSAAQRASAASKAFQKELADSRTQSERLKTSLADLGRFLPGTSGNVLRMVGDLQKIPEQLKSLSPTGSVVGGLTAAAKAAGPLAVGLVALEGSLKLLEHQVEENSKATAGFIASQVKVDVKPLDQFSFAMNATSKSIEDARRQAELQITVLKQNAATYQSAIDMASKQSVILRAADELAYHNQARYRDALGDTNKAIEQANTNLSALKSELIQGAAAAQDYLDNLKGGVSKKATFDALVATGDVEGAKKMRDDLGRRIKEGDTAVFAGAADTLQDPTVKSLLAQNNISTATQPAIETLRILSDVAGDQLPPRIQKIINGLLDLSDQLHKDTADFATLNETVIKDAAARQKEIEAGKKFIDNINEFTKTANEIYSMSQERTKTLQRRAEDDEITAGRQKIEKDYAQRIESAKLEDQVQEQKTKAQDDYRKRSGEIDTEYMQGELKAYADFRDEEERQTAEADKKRLRDLEAAQLDLRQAAAAGDVLAFVNRSNQAKLQLKHDTEDADDAAHQREAAFEKESNERYRSYQEQQDQAKRQLDEQTQLAEDAGKERISQADQLEHELQNLRDQWAEEDQQRTRDREQQDYDEKYNALIEHQGEVAAAIAGHYQDQLNIISDFGQKASDFLNGTLFNNLPIVGPAARDFSSDAPDSREAGNFDYLSDIANIRGSFAGGLAFVPFDMNVRVHKGEEIRTSAQNSRRSQPISVSIYNTVGNVATKEDLDNYQAVTVEGVKQAVIQSRGRGRAS